MSETMTVGEGLIAAERRRQVEDEGWSAEHDAEHGSVILRRAARCYEEHPGDEGWTPSLWPWDARWWKPKDHLANLIRAGALYLAAADVGDQPHLDALHRDGVARCSRKIDGILATAARVTAEAPR